MQIKLNFITFLFTILLPLIQPRFLSEQDAIIPQVIFSKQSGFYDSEFDLILTSNDISEIYYTTDASDPINSETSQKYSLPIKIKDRTSEPNKYSAYEEDENSLSSISRGTGYKKPTYNVDKAMIIRAVSKNANGFSKIFQHTYFITNNDLSYYEDFTIVSLITNEDNLFDPEKGIYVTGNKFLEWKNNGGNVQINPWSTKKVYKKCL